MENPSLVYHDKDAGSSHQEEIKYDGTTLETSHNNTNAAVVDHHGHIEGTIQLVGNNGQIRLVPTPSDDPNDPLRLSTLRKVLIFITCVWFATQALSIVGGFGALAPYFFGLYIPLGTPPDHVARLLTWPSLFTGLANFVMMPLALVVGRRPIFLAAAVLLIASSIWAAKSGTSFTSHLSARLVQGVAAGATESLIPLILTDITFVHQRGKVFGAYWVLQSIFTAVLNTGSSFEAANLHWTWYYWIFTILSSIGGVFAVFFLPETKFARPVFAVDGRLTRVDEFGTIVVLTDAEAAEVSARGDAEKKLSVATEADGQTPYIKTLKPFNGIESGWYRIMGRCYFDMARSLLDPAIVYSLGASSVALGVNIAISLSFGTVLEKAYNWPATNTGLLYLGALPAALFSFACAGWFGDWVNLYLAKRNGGVHLPEHRLPALIFPCVTGVASLLMYGFCADAAPKVHWFSIVFSVNYATFFFVSVLITTMTYAVEAMTQHAGAAIVMVVGGKNIISFGMSTAIVPLVNTGRYAYSQGILSGATTGWLLLAIPLYFVMPKFRKWRAGSKSQ